MIRLTRAVAMAFVVAALATPAGVVDVVGYSPIAGPATVSVAGNSRVDRSGRPVVLRGVNRPGALYPCIQGWGIFDGPSDSNSVAAIAGWHTNVVRLLLNEDCWLNINGVNPAYGGANYQNAIVNYVNLLHQHGQYAILALAWNAPGTAPATDQQVMADADHAPAFWQSVATSFKSDPGVLFDLFNEPHDISWACWRDGCTTSGGWQAAGMQALVTAVRGTGATQPIMLGGAAAATDLTQWLQYRPSDPANQMVADFHVYGPTWSGCVSIACWDRNVKPVAQQFPVVTGELGENDCRHAFIDPYMAWADLNGVSYLGYGWEAWPNGCATGPTLVSDYAGTPTGFGVGLRDHLATVARGLSLTAGGPRLVDQNGNPIVLHGVNRAAAVYPCIQGWGIFDGPSDAASVAAIASWHTNVVRIDLNEDCWLNINGVNPAYGGANYQAAILNYVHLLHQGGFYVILALSWNAPGTTASTGPQVMADADHSPTFWQSVASVFESDRAVLFDLYSEPHDISWACWRDGCTTADGWRTAGMQTLVDAVRSSGTTQPLLLGGLAWGVDLTGWLASRPSDSADALVAAYNQHDQSGCGTPSCWTGMVSAVAQQVPVLTGELREHDCAHSFIDAYMTWADVNGVSYLGSRWEAWPNACASGPTLISAYDGNPTDFGVGLRDHLAAIAR